MTKKIFLKKKKFNKIIIFFIIFILFIVFFYYLIKNQNKYIVIENNNKLFYIIPTDKEGKYIANLNKKGLHLSYKINQDRLILKNDLIKFSIQLFTSDNYDVVLEKRNYILNKKNTIFLPSELHIAIFEGNLGVEYFLLYKNFDNKNDAFNYCNKYYRFFDSCIVVNVEKF